ncbi:phage holin family protein, partial [Pseudomonas agarici]
GWLLLRRLALRSGACMVCGVSTIMLLYAAGLSIWTAGAFGCLTAMAGADVAIGLYERWAAKRLGVGEGSRPQR